MVAHHLLPEKSPLVGSLTVDALEHATSCAARNSGQHMMCQTPHPPSTDSSAGSVFESPHVFTRPEQTHDIHIALPAPCLRVFVDSHTADIQIPRPVRGVRQGPIKSTTTFPCCHEHPQTMLRHAIPVVRSSGEFGTNSCLHLAQLSTSF